MVTHRYNPRQSAVSDRQVRTEPPLSRIHRSALVPRPAEQLFDLVNDVAAYPARFDWCSGARAETLADDLLLARLEVRIAGLTTGFSTRNRLARPERIEIELADGPLERLTGRWAFRPLGHAGCRVTLDLEIGAGHSFASRLFAKGFGRIADRLVADFVRASLSAA
jgi:ribosome-associated toxin RatA of RatAB toxin-antitoxin module